MTTLQRNVSKKESLVIDKAIAILDKAASTFCGHLKDSDVAREYFAVRLGGLRREHFMVSYLDSGLRLISTDVEFIGSVDEVVVSSKEILRKALTYNATNVILAHNHPSGNVKPSADDINLTRKIQGDLLKFDIGVCDHIIVAYGSGTSSFNQEGLL